MTIKGHGTHLTEGAAPRRELVAAGGIWNTGLRWVVATIAGAAVAVATPRVHFALAGAVLGLMAGLVSLWSP